MCLFGWGLGSLAHGAGGVGLVAAFIFGFLMDVHDTTVLGSHAITYVLTMYLVFKIRKTMLNFEVIGQMVYMLPIFLFIPLPEHMLNAWMASTWSGWGWSLAGMKKKPLFRNKEISSCLNKDDELR